MPQVSFQHFYPLGFPEEISTTVCAPLPTEATAESLAAPVVAGQGVCTLLPFAGFYESPRRPVLSEFAGGYEGDWVCDWQLDGALDAPEDLPYGAHAALVVGRGTSYASVMADGYACKPRRYL